MMKIFICLICTFVATYSYALDPIRVTNEMELREAIEVINFAHVVNPSENVTKIIIDPPDGTLLITKELPEINSNIEFNGIDSSIRPTIQPGEGYVGRLVTIGSDGSLRFGFTQFEFNRIIISSFSSMDDGGAIFVKSFGSVNTQGVLFIDISSLGNGSVIVCEVDSNCNFINTNFQDCISGGAGTIDCRGNCTFENVIFNGVSADGFACAINAPSGSHVVVNQCSLIDDENHCHTNLFDVNGGNFTYSSCYAETDVDSDFASCTGDCEYDLNVWFSSAFKQKEQKTVCNDFGTGAFNSQGYNIDSGVGCFLDHATDLQNTNPMVTVDANGIPQPKIGSPLIESGPVDFVNNVLPCPYKDMNGLGRPQDFDADGVFTCDRGPVELQGGENLSNAQTGLFFDVDRNGEGIILEMLSATSALITMFTYDPNKTDLMWFIGVGNVVGNSVVIDNIQSTSGGVFGAGFDSNAIVNNDVGSLSVVFPDCNASSNPGRMVFQTKSPFKQSIENLLVKSSRLSRLLNCDQSQPNPQSGRSGAFYDPARSGEGVFVQVLDGGSAVVIFYTYTPEGKQFWLISSDVQITGSTLTANMIYPASTTGFGSQFNGSEIDFQSWGTLILEYQAGCSQVNMSYASTVTGFGSGNHPYQRLTQPAGTTCDL